MGRGIGAKVLAGCGIGRALFSIKVLKQRLPLYCEWEVTSHCTMRCRYCSTWIADRNATRDLSTEEALRIIAQLSGLGTRMIHFTGGEPTLREDLPALVEAAQKRRLLVVITTNGSSPPEKMGKLVRADLIRVSLDGTEKYHDESRGTPGAFQAAMATVRFLLAHQAKPQLTLFYTAETPYPMLEELLASARELNIQVAVNVAGINVNRAFDPRGNTRGSDLRAPFYQEYLAVVGKLEQKYGATLVNAEPLPAMIKAGGLDKLGCRALDATLTIKHDGRVSLPCNALPLRLARGPLREIFYGKETLKLRALQGRHDACRGCHIKCMGTASALTRAGNLAAILRAYRWLGPELLLKRGRE